MNGNSPEDVLQQEPTITIKHDEEETVYTRVGPGGFEPKTIEDLRAAFELTFDTLRGQKYVIQRTIQGQVDTTSDLRNELSGNTNYDNDTSNVTFKAVTVDSEGQTSEMRCIEALVNVLVTEQILQLLSSHADGDPKNVVIIRIALREIQRRLSTENDSPDAATPNQARLAEGLLQHMAGTMGNALCELASRHESLLIELLPALNRSCQLVKSINHILDATPAFRKLLLGATELDPGMPYFDYAFMSASELAIGLVDRDPQFQDLLLADPQQTEAQKMPLVQRLLRAFLVAPVRRSDDHEFCLYAAEAVHALCRRHTRNTRVLCEVANSDECLNLVKLLKKASDRLRKQATQEQQEYAFGLCNVLCFILGLIAFASNDCKRALTRHGALSAVIAHAIELPQSAEVQVSTCNATLGLLYQHTDNCVKFREGEGIELALQAMQAHAADLDVQESACQVLSVVSINDPLSRDALATPAAIGVLLAAVRNHRLNKESANMIANLFSVISAIAENSKPNQDMVLNEEGSEVLLQAMKEHPFEESVQQHGCCVLASLAERNEKGRVQLEGLGAVQVVLIAIAEFPQSERLQQHGNWALEVLKNSQTTSWLGIF